MVRCDTGVSLEGVLDDIEPISNNGVDYEVVIDGLTLLDENGEAIVNSDTITLHEGESKRFTIALNMSDGTTKKITKELKESFDQYYCEKYNCTQDEMMMSYFG